MPGTAYVCLGTKSLKRQSVLLADYRNDVRPVGVLTTSITTPVNSELVDGLDAIHVPFCRAVHRSQL